MSKTLFLTPSWRVRPDRPPLAGRPYTKYAYALPRLAGVCGELFPLHPPGGQAYHWPCFTKDPCRDEWWIVRPPHRHVLAHPVYYFEPAGNPTMNDLAQQEVRSRVNTNLRSRQVAVASSLARTGPQAMRPTGPEAPEPMASGQPAVGPQANGPQALAQAAKRIGLQPISLLAYRPTSLKAL